MKIQCSITYGKTGSRNIVSIQLVYSPDLAFSGYHLFASMGRALAEQRFSSYEDVKKWLYECT